MSNISFGSTYVVDYKTNGIEKFNNFQDFAGQKEISDPDNVEVRFKDKMEHRHPYNYSAQCSLIAPDTMDCDIESYCANQGISFTKLSTNELLNPSSILFRIKHPENKMTKVYIDSAKLEELAKTQESNIDHCQSDYDKYYSKIVENDIRSGENLPATTLCINSRNSKEDTLDYINRFGADKLNQGELFIDFSPFSEHDGTYFALKDMKIDRIPVYVNSDTYDMAKALGLLKY